MNKSNLIGAIITTLIINCLVLLIIISVPVGDSIEKVECYDRFSNEIIGEECIKRIDGFGSETEKMLLLIISLILINGLGIVLWWIPNE